MGEDPPTEAPTEVGDASTDPTIPPPPPPPKPPPQPPKASGLMRVYPKILNPADTAKAGAPNEPPPGRPAGGIKGKKVPVQTVLQSDARAQQIAQQRGQDLGSSSASAAAPAPPTAAQAAAATRQAVIDANKKQIEDRRAQQNAQLQQEMQPRVKAPSRVIGAPGNRSPNAGPGNRSPNAGPMRRRASRSPSRGRRRG